MSLYPFPGFILICENIMRFLLITLLAKLPTLRGEHLFDVIYAVLPYSVGG